MLVGKVLGPYVVEKELGNGAMGTVFRARHSKSQEKVAVKLISPAVASSASALARFTREITILKQLNHPNIVRYKGSGRFHGAPFYVMEYAPGESLDKVMARRGRMTWEEVVELGQQLCAGLQHAHDKGIIHRDLKPSNLMILPDGTIKLTDFGIAKDIDVTALTGANATVGTAAYMSPEQCRGSREITPQSDLYSMGVMFYELSTGRKPFTAETAMEMFLKHANAEFTRPSRHVLEMPIWLDTLICQLMEKKPEQRPHSAATVAQALQMVRDKVDAQLSAGVDAAKKRRVDRSARDIAIDATDKDAARQLLGKKKKKKTVPIYRQGWFTIAAVAGIGLIALALIYFLFIRAPSAETLYSQADALLKTKRDKEARAGPIADFLRIYPEDAQVKAVQQWADKIDTEIAEEQLLNRRYGKIVLAAENKAEEACRQALDKEERGDLDAARERWKEAAANRTSKDPDLRGYGLVALKRERDLDKVDELLAELERLQEAKGKGANDMDERALKALGNKQAGDAQREWTALRDDLEAKSKEPESRPYYLLALKKLHEPVVAPKK